MTADRPVLAALRKATAHIHQELEGELDAIARLSSLADRRSLLNRYYSMHSSAEQAMGPWIGDLPGLDYPVRRRTPLLARDLTELAISLPQIPAHPVTVGSAAEALGLMYVMEGSSLGGRMIRKAIAARQTDLTGLGFLDPYGARTGDRWREFLEVLEREGAADVGGVALGGVKGFGHARACLLSNGTPA